MRKIILFLLMLLPMAVKAYVEVDGIYYIFKNNEAIVTCKGTPGYSWYSVYEGNVIIPSTVTYNDITYTVTTIGQDSFNGCSKLLSVTIPNSVTSIESRAFQSCSGLTSIDIPSSITSIGIAAFQYCTGLSEVIIPNSVTSLGAYAFAQCSNLTSIDIPNSISELGHLVFEETPWYTDLYNNHPDGIIYIASVAYTYKGSIPSGTLVLRDGTLGIAAWAFMDRSELSNIYIPNSVTNIGEDAFRSCTSLTSIDLPSSLISIGYGAFCYCTGFTKLEMPKSLRSIGDMAFQGCNNLSQFVFSESIHDIGMQAFGGCKGLKQIFIPNSTKIIGDRAFSNCTGLQRIELPSSLENIGIAVFQSCGNLSSLMLTGEGEFNGSNLNINTKPVVYIDSRITAIKGLALKPSQVWSYAITPPSCDENTFKDYSGNLHIPASALASYFTAPYWSNFANIIGDAIEPNVTISNDSLEMSPGEVISLSASVVPVDATPTTNISWTTTNSSVAIVDVNNGSVTATGIGECDIIARYLHKTAICHVIVNDTTIRIELDCHEARLLPNHILIINPSGIPVLPNIIVESSNPSVAAARIMNDVVQVVGIKEGTTTITVGSVDGTAIPATCLVTVYTEPGDLNCDGFLDVSDVTSLINCILNSDNSQINNKNADVNGDNIIDVVDVTTLISIILSGN